MFDIGLIVVLRRLFCTILLLFCVLSFETGYSQANGKGVSQRFFMQVDDLLDLGFIDEEQAFTSTGELTLDDIESGNMQEYTFRIRTNEPFRLTIQTIMEDSLGGNMPDSVLQVKMTSGKNEESKHENYKSISNNPITLIKNSAEDENKIYKVKYRSKPGSSISPEVKKLSIVFTASYP